MIKSKADLHEYIEADRKANHMVEHYWLKLIYGNENARAFRYLKVLRKYEYAQNNHSIWSFWYRFVLRRLDLKYGISIFPNMVDKGLYISHLVGGEAVRELNLRKIVVARWQEKPLIRRIITLM